MKDYKVVPFRTGCVSGALHENQLQQTLNQYGDQGWTLTKTIHETQKVFVFFQREAHFLIFERDAGGQRQIEGQGDDKKLE
jgi:hypothetical protein